jgi:hypothetical protein
MYFKILLSSVAWFDLEEGRRDRTGLNWSGSSRSAGQYLNNSAPPHSPSHIC